MAHKINTSATPADTKGADDLEKLLPYRTVPIAGRKVTVREYGFLDGLLIKSAAKEVVDALAAVTGDQGIDSDDIEDVLDRHPEALIALMAKACDLEPDAVATLSDVEGALLKRAWWDLNAGFFVRRVARRVAVRLAAAHRGGETSSPPSSPTATTPSDSAPTPTAS